MAGARSDLPPKVREKNAFDLVCDRVFPSSVKDPPMVVVRRGLLFFGVGGEVKGLEIVSSYTVLVVPLCC